MNLKKLLSAIGLLAVAAPAALSAVACGEDETSPEQKEANKLAIGIEDDLKNNEFYILDYADAKDQITAKFDAVIKNNKLDSKLIVEYTFPSSIKMPTPPEHPIVDLTIEILIKKDKDSEALATAKPTLHLKLKDQNAEDQEKANKAAKNINSMIRIELPVFDKKTADEQIKAVIPTIANTELYLDINLDYTLPEAGKSLDADIKVLIKKDEKSEPLATATAKFKLTLIDEENETDLSKVIKTKTVDGNDYNTQEAILNLIVEKDGIDKETIQVKEFNKATKDADGSAKITPAEGNEKYTGEANIIITKIIDDEDSNDQAKIDAIQNKIKQELEGKEFSATAQIVINSIVLKAVQNTADNKDFNYGVTLSKYDWPNEGETVPAVATVKIWNDNNSVKAELDLNIIVKHIAK